MNTLLISIAAFAVTIGVLVTFHELGHYLAARAMGVKVLKFSIGFGRSLWTRRLGRDQTEWTLAAIPLGGYVRMLDGRVDSVSASDRNRAFEGKPVWRRSIIILAGPMANFLLAALIYAFLYMKGVPGIAPVVATPSAGTVAAAAGLTSGERILTFGGERLESFADLRFQVLDAAVKRASVAIETEDARGTLYVRRLDFSLLQSADLEKELNTRIGLDPYVPPIPAIVGTVQSDSAAARAGLQAGDRVVAIDGEPIADWQGMVRRVNAAPGREITLSVRRGPHMVTLRGTPEARQVNGRAIGRLGVMIDRTVEREAMSPYEVTVRHGPMRAAFEGVRKTWDSSIFTLKMLGKMVMGELSWKNLSGPITIADYAGRSATAGGMPFLEFLALISVSLGVINLLPIPVLDGGHLLYHLAEAVRGKPISDRALELSQRLGLGVIVFLAVFAIYNDIGRLLGAG
jgi:regulator of sigma E protease